MTKVISASIAALFAAVTFNVAAQAPDTSTNSAATPKSQKPATKPRKTKKPCKATKTDSTAAPVEQSQK